MASNLPFWDPGAFVGTAQDPNISQPIRTIVPDGPPADGWDPALSVWEVIYFANIRAPGIARVSGGRRRIVDPRLIPGSSGQLPTVMAYMPAEYTVTLMMWDPYHLSAFKALADVLHPKPNPQQIAATVQKLQAIDVYHPAFQALNVKSVYIVDIRAPEPGPIPQSMVSVIDCFEFVPPYFEGVTAINSSAAEISPGVFTPPAAPASRTPPKGPDQTNVNP